MVKYFYRQHSNHFSNLTTSAQKRWERRVAKISSIPPLLRGTTTKWLILGYFDVLHLTFILNLPAFYWEVAVTVLLKIVSFVCVNSCWRFMWLSGKNSHSFMVNLSSFNNSYHQRPTFNNSFSLIFFFFNFFKILLFFYFNYSYITYITATENNLQYSYIYSYITYVFCFLQIRTLQCNTIFKTILVEERLNKITIYFKRKEKKQKRLQCVECTTYNL